MMLRRRLVPVGALVVAIGASAAGAATAAETGSSGAAGGAHKGQKPVICKVVPPGGVTKKGPGVKHLTPPADADAAKDAGRIPAEAAGRIPGGLAGKISGELTGKIPGDLAGKGHIELKSGGQPGVCKKPVKAVSLDTAASELGVSKAALVQAISDTKQWIAASGTKPTVAQFEQHLADLLHVPVAKVASVFDPAAHVSVNTGA